jgi:L-threonylcarbamoyladenylate synthase
LLANTAFPIAKGAMAVELTTHVLQANREAIVAAARMLSDGGLVAFPTETVYGLGADATNGEAVARLYAAKGRPRFNPLISHVPDAKAADGLARFPGDARRLAETFWPGPLTLVLAKADGCPVSELAAAGLDSIAVRVPAHPVARDLLKAFGKPVVAPSANQSGHVSPTTAQHVLTDLDGRIDLVLDDGATNVGIESTIVSCLDAPTLLRPGGLPREDIERVLGHALLELEQPMADEAPLAPGMLASHYAPRASLRMNATGVRPGEALLAFGPNALSSTHTRNLSPKGDLVEAAANLFSHLRTLDSSGARAIAVMPIPNEGLGEAINDRLVRAAVPR